MPKMGSNKKNEIEINIIAVVPASAGSMGKSEEQ